MTSSASFGGSFDTQKDTIMVVLPEHAGAVLIRSIVMTCNMHEIRQDYYIEGSCTYIHKLCVRTLCTLNHKGFLRDLVCYTPFHAPSLALIHHCHSLQNVCMNRGSVLTVFLKTLYTICRVL